MSSIKVLGLLIFIGLSKSSTGQRINRMFSSNWADTRWTFVFRNDGTYERISNGHFGNTVIRGAYKMRKDTIELLTGFEKTHRTVNPMYLLDKDGFLIDIWLRYDYAPFNPKKGEPDYNRPSRLRDIKYPQVSTIDTFQKIELSQMLVNTLKLDTLKKIFARESIIKEIEIKNYYQLNDSTFLPIVAHEVAIKFSSAEAVNRRKYIEIEDINMNSDETSIEIKIHANNIQNVVWVYFFKEDRKWQFRRLSTFRY